MGFAGEGFPRAHFTSLVDRTVDLEATRRPGAEMGTAADRAGSMGGGGTSKEKAAPSSSPANGQPQRGGKGAAACRRRQGARGKQKGAPQKERRKKGGDTRTVYRWHVDSLMGGEADMDVVPLMEDGFVTNWDVMEKVWEPAEGTRLWRRSCRTTLS
ncbi:unnamed protein product [Ectocarpus sp. 12 AP-2014]